MKTILIVLTLLAAQVSAQPPQPVTKPQPQPQPPAAPAAEDEYVVGAGDELSFKVFGEDAMTRDKLPVDPDGTIEVDQLGRVSVIGKTTRQIEEFVADELVKRQLFVKRPPISVRVVEFRSQSVRVQGQVKMPGEKTMLRGTLSLLDAIYQSGSFTADAGLVVQIFNRRPNESAERMMDRKPDLEVPRDDVDTGRALQVRLKDGDLVFVPRADTFSVTGSVKSPGIYTWRPKLTIWEAVSAIAGGLTERGSKRSIRTLRTVNGKQQEIKPKKIERDLVQPGDTIVVGNRIM
jgi:polysaccharide export outer membrane protein